MSRSRSWCVTLNNYTEEEYKDLCTLECRYLVVGKEVGDEGTPHLQAYIVFPNGKSLKSVKKLIPRAHLEPAKGDSRHNRDYCTKDGNFEEFGERPLAPSEKGEANKRRWEDAFKAATEGRFDDIPYDIRMKYYSTVKRIYKDSQNHLDSLDGVCGVWLYGPPGTGKSHTARVEFPNAYIKSQNKWFDGYDPSYHDTVLLDDLDSFHLGHLLKIWADKYPFNAETKGGVLFIRPKKIVVTSNYSIADLFRNDSVLAAAIERRFEIRYLGEVYNE